MKQKPGRVPLQGGTFSLSSWLLLQRYKDGELREHLSLAQSWKLWWYILLEMCRARRRGTCCPRPGKDSPYMLHSRCHEVMHDPSCRKRPLFAYVPNGTQMLNKLPTMFEAIIRPCLRSYVNLPRLNWPFPTVVQMRKSANKEKKVTSGKILDTFTKGSRMFSRVNKSAL